IPATKASMTVRMPMTRAKAAAITAVLIQRARMLRRGEFKGALAPGIRRETSAPRPTPSPAPPMRTTPRSSRPKVIRRNRLAMVFMGIPDGLSYLREHFRHLDRARVPRRQETTEQPRPRADGETPPQPPPRHRERREERDRERHAAVNPVDD